MTRPRPEGNEAGQTCSRHPAPPGFNTNLSLNHPRRDAQPGSGPAELPGCARLPAPPGPVPSSPSVRFAAGSFCSGLQPGWTRNARSGESLCPISLSSLDASLATPRTAPHHVEPASNDRKRIVTVKSVYVTFDPGDHQITKQIKMLQTPT